VGTGGASDGSDAVAPAGYKVSINAAAALAVCGCRQWLFRESAGYNCRRSIAAFTKGSFFLHTRFRVHLRFAIFAVRETEQRRVNGTKIKEQGHTAIPNGRFHYGDWQYSSRDRLFSILFFHSGIFPFLVPHRCTHSGAGCYCNAPFLASAAAKVQSLTIQVQGEWAIRN